MYSQALEEAGYRVERQFALGPREFVGPALEAGLIELVPEYAGTALEFLSLGDSDGDERRRGDARGPRAVALEDADVLALAAAPAQNANTFVVTADDGGRLDLDEVSDLAAVAGRAHLRGAAPSARRAACASSACATCTA